MAHGSVELRPDADQAWLLIASIQLVRGEPDLAQDACGRLTRSSWLVAVGCHARVSHARGDSEAVQSRVERLIGIIDRSDFMEADLAWFLAIAGDLAAANERTSLAVERFQQSLALSESAQVRAALVDVLIGAERYIAARDALAGGSTAPPLEIRRMIVATRLGRQSDMASEIAATDRTFQEWMAAEDWLHAREMARFYLDVLPRPELARHIALINIEIQREIEDLRLLLRTGQATSL